MNMGESNETGQEHVQVIFQPRWKKEEFAVQFSISVCLHGDILLGFVFQPQIP